MIRKLLVVAAAIAMPMSAGAVAIVGTSAVAGAAAPAINCATAGTVTFAAPGLSHNGAVTLNKTTTTHVTAEKFSKGKSACTGTGPGLSITSNNTSCTASGADTTYPACKGHTTGYGYDSWSGYASTGISAVKAAAKTITATVNGVTYTSTTSTASGSVGAATCAKSKTYGSETGYEVKGTITKQSTGTTYLHAATTFVVCLGSVTGTSLTTAAGATKPGFLANFGGTKNLVKTALFDPTESSLNIA